MKKAFKLPFGLKNGEIVDISKVENGLKCGCICPNCNSKLIARKGAKTSHHFAHYNAPECKYGYETAIHLMSKKILQEYKKLRLPSVNAKLGENKYRSILIHNDCHIDFDDVLVENRSNNIIPDIILVKNNKKLLVEIAVTHYVDELKLAKIKSQKVSAIEIDLSKESRVLNEEILTEIIINGLENKKWINNLKWDTITNKLRKYYKSLNINSRGFTKHIDNCPIRIRVWKGKSYANYFDDCPDCNYFFGEKNINEIFCVGANRNEADSIFNFYIKKGCS